MNICTDRALDGTSVLVVGVDFSEASYDAVTLAVDIARMTGDADAHFIHVLKAPLLVTSELGSESFKDYERAIRVAEQRLDAICNSATEQGSGRAIAHIRTGEPYLELIQLVYDVDAHVLVVGSHGPTGLPRLLGGSVEEKVRRHSPCPVLTVKPKAMWATRIIATPCASCQDTRVGAYRVQQWCEQNFVGSSGTLGTLRKPS